MGSGFTFKPAEVKPFVEAVRAAVKVYNERPRTWRQVQLQGMWRDYSWGRAAAQYDTVLQGMMHPEKVAAGAKAAGAVAVAAK